MNQSTEIINDAPRPHIRVPRAETLPSLNADFDDAAWRDAAIIDGLTLSLGPQGRGLEVPPTQVQLLWSPQHLYIRFVAWSDEIYAPFGTARDAPHYEGDVSEVFLDPVGDARQWIEMQCSPDGGVFDKLFLATAPLQAGADGTVARDSLREVWDFTDGWQLQGLQTAAGRWKNGWLTEFAVPAAPALKRSGQTEFAPMTMRANLLRYEWRLDNGERRLSALNWAPVKWGQPHRSPHAMGWLDLVE